MEQLEISTQEPIHFQRLKFEQKYCIHCCSSHVNSVGETQKNVCFFDTFFAKELWKTFFHKRLGQFHNYANDVSKKHMFFYISPIEMYTFLKIENMNNLKLG